MSGDCNTVVFDRDAPARQRALWTRSGGQLALLALSMAGGMFALSALNPLQEAVKQGLRLSDNQIGLVQGIALVLPLVVVAVPFGMHIDRGNRARFLVVLAMLCAVGTGLSGLAQNFATLFAARMLIGLGLAGEVPAAISLMADLLPPALRGRSTMILVIGQVVGATSAFACGGALLGLLSPAAGFDSWQLALFGMTVPLLIVVLLLLWLHEPLRHGTATANRVRPLVAVAELWSLRGIVAPMLIGLVTVATADVAVMTWAAPVLSRSFGLGPAKIGSILGIAMLIAGLTGPIAGGLLADLFQRSRGSRGVTMLAILATLMTSPAGLFAVMPSATANCIVLTLFLIGGYATAVIVTALVTLLLPNELRGFTLTLSNATSKVVSMSVGPVSVTLLASELQIGSGLPAALTWVAICTTVASAAAFVFLLRRLSGTAPSL